MEWMGVLVGICAWTPLDVLAVSLGLSNILLWLFAQIPQIYLTWKRKRAEAISAGFLAIWLVGDITNLLGSIFTQQIPIQLYTAIYFCFMDIIMVSQWIYYNKISPPPNSEPLIATYTIVPKYVAIYFLIMVNLISFPVLFNQDNYQTGYTSSDSSSAQMRVLLQTNITDLRPCEFQPNIAEWGKIFGDVSAWTSAVLYNFARFPQIYLNYQRKTVEGLSIVMFALVFMANVFYGASVLLLTKEFNMRFYVSTLPFIIGSLGTVLSNTVVIIQWLYYDKCGPRTTDEFEIK